MTREEEIDNAKTAFYERVLEDDYYYDPRDCFEEGAKWADEHPKSPWINVDEDLPCNHEELIIDEQVFGIWDKHTKPVICNKSYGVSCVGIMIYNVDKKAWHWVSEKPTHWFPIPELPKEQEIKL